MVGVWIAFEDVVETNGTLRIVPGSHKWPVYEYHNLNLPHPDTIENGEAHNYKIYEDYINKIRGSIIEEYNKHEPNEKQIEKCVSKEENEKNEI